MITPDGFQFLLRSAEVRLRGKFELEFVSELYDYFKDHDEELLQKAFDRVGGLAVPVDKIRFEDFTREVGRAHMGGTREESILKAVERRRAHAAEKKKANESWTKSTDEVLEEEAKKGNAFAARLLADKRKERGK